MNTHTSTWLSWLAIVPLINNLKRTNLSQDKTTRDKIQNDTQGVRQNSTLKNLQSSLPKWQSIGL